MSEFGKGILEPSQIELAKKRAEQIRWKAIENLEKNLLEYESKALKKGFKIIWCSNKQEALNEVSQILNPIAAKKIKTYYSSEQFDAFGTQILMQDIHESCQKIHSNQLHENVINKNIAIANTQLIIAENGSVIFESNDFEINDIVHSDILIGIAPIHQIAATIQDAEFINGIKNAFQYKSFSSTSQIIFNKISEKENEKLVPKEIYILLLDNHYEKVLENIDTRKALYCIDCGICAQVCPIVNTEGQTHSLSPIHSLIAAVNNPKNDTYSSYSTLCSACSKVCPVNIPIHSLLQKQRESNQLSTHSSTSESLFRAAIKKTMLNRKFMNQNVKLKGFMFNNLIPKNYKYRKFLPEFSNKTFNELWKEKNK